MDVGKEYARAVNQYIDQAEDYANIHVGMPGDYKDRVELGHAWNRIYFKKMDELCEAVGLRKRRVK